MIESHADQNGMTGDDTLSAYLDGLLTETIPNPGEGEGKGNHDTPETEVLERSPESLDNIPPPPKDTSLHESKEDEGEADEEELKLLTFTLGRLHFAALTEQVSKVLSLDKTQLSPGAAGEGIIGSYPGEQGKIQVIDTARLILPGKIKGGDYHHLLVLNGGEYGLACESVTTGRDVPWEQVRWREERGTRPWLLGMMKDQEVPCPLIDVLLLLEGLDT